MLRHRVGFFYIFVLVVSILPGCCSLFAEPGPSVENLDFTESPSDLSDRIVYFRILAKKARENKLYDERFWHLLLHYHPQTTGGFESRADGPDFFFAKNGKTDPAAEIESTLESFFSDEPDEYRHPQCRFPLRYAWLKEKLHFDSRLLPEHPCENVQKFLKLLDADSVSLIFSSYFMGSAASMFGHTLIKLNSEKNEAGLELLDWAIHFSAETPPVDTLTFAWKGLFGGFPGRFTTVPYHLKVREYNDIENRDLWEYRLNFNRAEIQRLLLHNIEMGNTYFDYFYLDENCSYQLLGLIEVARPELHLTDQFSGWVAPGETLRVLTAQKDLIAAVNYRPSAHSILRRELGALSEEERDLFFRLFNREEKVTDKTFLTLTPETQLLIFDLLLSSLKYKKQRKKSTEEDQALYSALLVQRTQMESEVVQRAEHIRLSDPPHLGHKIWRIRFGGGASTFGGFSELGWRASFHDLLNDDTGFAPFTNFEFMDLTVRYFHDRKEADLEHLTFFKIFSLPRYEFLSRDFSYTIDSGISTVWRPVPEPPFVEKYILFDQLLRDRPLPEALTLDRALEISGPDPSQPRGENYFRTHPVFFDLQFGYTLHDEYSPISKSVRLTLLAGIRGESGSDGFPPRAGPVMSAMVLFGNGPVKGIIAGGVYGFSASGDETVYRGRAGFRYAIDPDCEIRLEASGQEYFNQANLSLNFHW